jgi:anti-sigma factor RsiW
MSRHLGPRLSAYMDGELAADEAAAIERHLLECTECSRELAIMNTLGGAMRTMTSRTSQRSVWDRVHRRLTQPAGWILLVAGAVIWAALALVAWARAELTIEWVAATGVATGLLLLLAGLGYEQYREWKETRYKDVQR